MTEYEKLDAFILKEDIKLNKLYGWNTNQIKGYFKKLNDFGEVEVGFRSSCGVTDNTMKVYSVWLKIIKRFRQTGAVVTETRVKHRNAYASNNGGFWNSTIFTLKNTKKGISNESSI